MKSRIPIVVLAGLLITASASFAQVPQRSITTHRPTSEFPVTTRQQFNLNGIWQSHTPQGQPFTFRFEQHGDKFRAIFGGATPQSTDFLGFEGRYQGNAITGHTLAELAMNGQPAQWKDQTWFVDDPDHIRFGNHAPVVRISAPLATDAKCDAMNSSHTQGEYAASRGEDASRHNDIPTAACWLRTGANQNNSRAEADYAWLLESGKTGTKDFPQALIWAKKATAQRDPFAALLLKHMFIAGEGVPVDPRMADYWNRQANLDFSGLQQQQKQLAAQQAQHVAPAPQIAQQQHQMSQEELGIMMLLGMAMMDGAGDSDSDAAAEAARQNSDQMRQEVIDKEIHDRIYADCHQHGSVACF